MLNAFRHHCSFHPAITCLVKWRRMCSTPFGIIVRSTRCDDKASAVPDSVLNAFRHHCSFHPFGIGGAPYPLAVLNAFRHHCSFHVQRKVESDRLRPNVLNAFRHHCSFHNRLPGCGSGLLTVLNAFRHHCSFHIDIPGRPREQLPRCSTPFGIIVRSTTTAMPPAIA